MKRMIIVFLMLCGVGFGATNYFAWGDSITNRVGASDDAHSYINLIAANFSYTLTNKGTNGDQAKDKAVDVIAQAVVINEVHSVLLGYNDMRFWDTSGETDEYKNNLSAQIAHLAIPDSEKILANSVAVTEAGTWAITPASLRFRDTGRFCSTTGGTATFSFTGNALLVWLNRFSNAAGGIADDIQISVDGRPVTYRTTFDSTLTDGDSNADKSIQLAIVSDLSDGIHSAEIKRVSTNGIGWEFAAGIDVKQLRTTPKVYVGNVMRTDATGYASAGTSLAAVGSDIQVSKYNEIIRDNCKLLASLGLWVAHVDILEGFIPIDDTTDPTNGMLETPLSHLHPNDKGHQHIADKFISIINDGEGAVRATVIVSGLRSRYSGGGR